ncbi:MAG: hypothetical protein IJB83_05675 [Bacilli bacterium]|nr:hypothetical protein [Bacilli bacterium]
MSDFKKINSLRKTFYSIEKENRKKSKNFSYAENYLNIKRELESVLKEEFGNYIKIEENDSLTNIYCNYMGSTFEIDTYNGIRLVLDKVNDEYNIMSAINYILSGIMGEAICKYMRKDEEECSAHVIYEWSMHPEHRLKELKNCYRNFYNFEDYYTYNLIRSFGNNILSMDAYMAIFGDSEYIDYEKILKINEVKPEIGYEKIVEWANECKSQLSLKR